jgi:CubicO group peptidase (beta-lactamase class C family)
MAQGALAVALTAVLTACGPRRVELPVQRQPVTTVADRRFEAAIADAERIVAPLTAASPAVSAAVAVAGEIVWSAAFGFANLESGTRATPAHQFRVYSLSKGITAATLLSLAEDDVLDLDAPLARYVADFPRASELTLRRLAGHLGGIRHYRGEEAIANRPCDSPAEALALFRDDAYEEDPGARYLYSSWGYVLLSAAIAAAAGDEFQAVVQRHVLQPAGMTATVIDDPGATLNKATPYEPGRGNVTASRPVDSRCKWGGGAFVSTAEDMARFGVGLMRGTVVQPASFRAMITPLQDDSGRVTTYGMGLGVSRDSAGTLRVGHSGSAIGGRAAIQILPELGVVAVILSNVEGETLVRPTARLADLFARR